jgi:hypothetical protein
MLNLEKYAIKIYGEREFREIKKKNGYNLVKLRILLQNMILPNWRGLLNSEDLIRLLQERLM